MNGAAAASAESRILLPSCWTDGLRGGWPAVAGSAAWPSRLSVGWTDKLTKCLPVQSVTPLNDAA